MIKGLGAEPSVPRPETSPMAPTTITTRFARLTRDYPQRTTAYMLDNSRHALQPTFYDIVT